MVDKIARLKYLDNSFEIIENGTYVICAVSKKKNSFGKVKLLECSTSGALFLLCRGQHKER